MENKLINVLSIKLNYSIFNNTPCSYQIKFVNSNIEYSVPLDPANTDYQAIQKWIDEGGEVIDNPPTQENN
jgi:hypothetical protein